MDDLLLEECELIVALEYAKAAIESVDVQIAFLPPDHHGAGGS